MTEFGIEVHQNEFLPPGATDVQAIVSVTATGTQSAEVVIVDCSASMSSPPTKFGVARAAVRAAVDALRDGAYFAVIAGSHDARMVYPPTGQLVAATTRTRAEALAAVDRMSAGGGTVIGRWLRLANQLFDAQPDVVKHAVLIADGPDQHETAGQLEQELAACRGRFTCDCLSTDPDVGALRTIASALSGTVTVVPEPSELPELVATAMRVVAADVSLRLWTPVGAEVQQVRQVAPRVEDLTAARIGRYPTGAWEQETRDYDIRIRVVPGALGDTMLAGRVAVVTADGVLAQGLIKATWTDDVALATSVDAQVAHYLGQVELTDAISEGLAAFRAGDEATATRLLARALELARRSGNDEIARRLAQLVDTESDVVRLRARPQDETILETSSVRSVRIRNGGTIKRRPRRRSKPAEPVVNTGFADPRDSPIPPDQTLVTGGRYAFWVDLGPQDPHSIEETPAPLSVRPPSGSVLTVAVFGFDGELEIDPDAAIRDLRPGGRVFFPVRVPMRSGTHRMRCGIYWRQVLLESRVITVHATDERTTQQGALRSTVDYRLANPADVPGLPDVAPHTASLFLNDNGDGSHALRVLATDGTELLRADTTLGEAQLATQIRLARGALRKVAWGTTAPWLPADRFRHAAPATLDQLTDDLSTLAVNGYRLHHLLLRSLGRATGDGTYGAAERLRRILARPGTIQVALKDSAQHVLPVALLYDLPLDTNARQLDLCQDFVLAWRAGGSLAMASCFRGECRQARDPRPDVVCPGGFWGYRHALGLPVSVGRDTTLPTELVLRRPVRLAAGLYRDFKHVDEHCRRLHDLLPGAHWQLNDERDAVLHALRVGDPDVVYFYCHGGVDGDVPYLRVGRGNTGPVITPDNLFSSNIRWSRSHPLVFLNGCRTTDLEPERAIDFVSFFVEDASACGVIGTEITVFEEFAKDFAEECLRRFLVNHSSIGSAVTQARLALLSKGNPLGLSYIPFVLPSIRVSA